MKKITFIPVIILLISNFSCEKIALDKDNDDFDKDSTKNDFVELKSAELIDANNNFAFEFFKEVAAVETTQNYMVSPVSLSLALGMAYNGSAEDTKTAFENTMGYPNWGFEQINEANQTLISNLVSNVEGNIFEVANSIWSREGFRVKQEFINLNKEYYSAEVRSMDFNAPWAVDTINGWVSRKTHEKIPTIINEIPAAAMLYLLNALYFNATWKYEFNPESNEERRFYPEGTENGKLIEMMSQEASLKYLKNDLFSSVILPYKEDKYKMVLMRPENKHTTTEIIETMDGAKWLEWKNNYNTKEEVVVTMPKFKFDYQNRLNDEMINMGLGIAFDPGSADFSRISDIQLYISYILQKTYIDVNEEGTEAAAVTIIGFETTSIGPSEPEKIYFTLDRPFVFVITEKETDAICFIGKVGNPEYEEE